ncbi:hypothetical protein UYO_1815 [Lachnospiraceae bacterium JC7]|nr:hypothetical protein UYO_1815 [Lachnospiraceae bacterium JC7]
MKLNKTIKAMITAVTLSTLVSIPAMADWQYTLYGPMAVWTNTVTGEQTTVYAGQPAPDGTPAPTLTLTQENTEASYDVNAAIAAANAAVDAAKAARGGNSTGNTLTAEQLAANTAAANANMNTNTVTVINGVSGGNKSSGLSNADLPMISTGDQSNSSGLSDGSYVGPGNSVSAKINGSTAVSTQNSSYVAKDGHIVTNAQAPDVNSASTSSVSTGTTGSSVPGTSTAASTPAATGNTVVNYGGTLPSTGASNVNTYSSPGAGA